MKILKKILPIILLSVAITLIGTSCNDDGNNDNKKYSCDNEGLYYTLDGGSEVYLPSTYSGGATNFYTQSTSSLTVHQMPNGYLFQSSATDIDQVSGHNIDVTSSPSSKLDIFSLWSNTDTVNITYTCKRLDQQINGTAYYTFTGTYTDSQNNTHTIEGYLCVKLDEIRP